jgi:hypothetical protein
MGKKLIPEDKVDFLANVPLQHAVLDRPVFGKVQLSLILDLSSIRSKEMDTELALLPAGQWQAGVPLTQQAGTTLKLDDFPASSQTQTGHRGPLTEAQRSSRRKRDLKHMNPAVLQASQAARDVKTAAVEKQMIAWANDRN